MYVVSVRRICTWPRMVAPSFVTVMSPSGEMRILSRPLGPCSMISIKSGFFIAYNPYQRCPDDV